MLVLSRRINEEVWIGADVVVRVVKIRVNTVTLAVEAPAEVVVDRAEIRQRKAVDALGEVNGKERVWPS